MAVDADDDGLGGYDGSGDGDGAGFGDGEMVPDNWDDRDMSDVGMIAVGDARGNEM